MCGKVVSRVWKLVWRLWGGYLECVGRLSGCCGKPLWRLSGGCREGVGRLSVGCGNALWRV